MKIAFLFIAAATSLLVQTAKAQVKGAFYLGADAGGSFLEATTLHANSGLGPVATQVEFDPGYRLGLRLGYFVVEGAALRFRNSDLVCNFALELDSGFIGNSVANTTPGHSIDFYQVPLVVNAIVIFPVTERFSFSLGLGAGGAVTMLNASAGSMDETSSGFGFAYQGLGSVSYRLTPHLIVSGFGKVMGSPKTDFPEEAFQGTTLGAIKMDGPLSISGGLGITYLF